MRYLFFSFWFIVIHTMSYLVAGALALRISGDLYKGENRLLDYIKDMSNEEESGYVTRFFLPMQLIRGLLFSVVLYPILGLLGALSFTIKFIFIAGLMFVFTDFACAVPSPNNLEGFVYMKKRYLKKNLFWKLYFEMIIYSLLVGLLTAWFLI